MNPKDDRIEREPPSNTSSRTPADSSAIVAEEKLVSHWRVLLPTGEMIPAESYEFGGDTDFAALYAYETRKRRPPGEDPPHVRLMREMELVDYEPGSDAGNFRWYPNGQLIKRLLEARACATMHEAGAMQVETPIMYDFEHPALKQYLDRFPARQYIVRSEDKDYFLRFAACFGQYLIFHDMVISVHNLPVRLYELTHYSFRREQTGELSGLRRLRAFTMPDMHTLVADIERAKTEFLSQFDLCRRWMDQLGVPYQAALRVVGPFFEQNREIFSQLAARLKRPVLLELWDERFFYFVCKFEFHNIDTQGRAAGLSTGQIDVENAERFGIFYTDADGVSKHPLLLHASIPGAIERNLYAILEYEARRIAEGKKGMFPFWLAPTQVRFVAVTDSAAPSATQLARQIEALCGARVDVDDRDESVGKKIRDAEREWVPLVIVYGEREASGEKLPVRTRDSGQTPLSLSELVKLIESLQLDYPRMPLAVPSSLRARPTFRG